jgi:hypothetical protein
MKVIDYTIQLQHPLLGRLIGWSSGNHARSVHGRGSCQYDTAAATTLSWLKLIVMQLLLRTGACCCMFDRFGLVFGLLLFVLSFVSLLYCLPNYLGCYFSWCFGYCLAWSLIFCLLYCPLYYLLYCLSHCLACCLSYTSLFRAGIRMTTHWVGTGNLI